MKTKPFVWMGSALLLASSILFLPFSYVAILFAGLFIFCACSFFPKKVMMGLAIFLLFQKLLINRFIYSAPAITLVIKRSEDWIILCAFVVIVGGKILRDKGWKRTPTDLPLSCLVALAFLGTLRSHLVSPFVAMSDLFLLLRSFFVFYIFYVLQLNKSEVLGIFKVLCSIAILFFLGGFIDLAMPEKFRTIIHAYSWVDYSGGIPSVQSFFSQPGDFGWFMAFFSCFALAFFIVLEKRRYLVLALCFGIGALMSMKLKPLLGLFVSISLTPFILFRQKKIRSFIILAFAILILFFCFWSKIQHVLGDRVYTYIQSPQASQGVARTVLYKTGFHIARDYFPFGSGLATFGGWIASLNYSPLYDHYGLNKVLGLGRGGAFLTDTFWPYIIGEFGFLGCFLYVLILCIFFKLALNIFHTSDDLFLKTFSLAAVFILAEGLVESFADPFFIKPPQYYFIFACYGILWSFKCTLKHKTLNKAERSFNSEGNGNR